MYNKKKTVIVVMMIAVMLMATGYAWFATTLNISTQGNISSMWSVYFSSISEGTAVGTATNAITPNVSGTSATISVNLASPGDSMTYKLTLTNSGNIDAIIEKINAVATGSSAIVYSISGISNGEKLGEGQSKEITLKVEYDPNVTSQPADTGKTLTISIVSVQDVGQDIDEETPSIDQPLLLSSQILKNNIAQADTNIDFSQISSDTNGKGLYYTSTNTENGGTTYYFRGAVDNNYVKFGKDSSGNDILWRIVRINEDGSIRIVTQNNVGTSAFNTNYDDNAYVGYMYGLTGITSELTSPICVTYDSANNVAVNSTTTYTTKTSCEKSGGEWATTAYEATHANVVDSTIKAYLDEWYEDNLKTNYSSYLADTGFCNDRSVASTANTWNSNDTALGYAKNYTQYGAYNRLANSSSPQFKCQNESNDLFTTSTSNKGNKALTNPIGLLTADELSYAGLKEYLINDSIYLDYVDAWTMSPFTSASSANEWFIGYGGDYELGYGAYKYGIGVELEMGIRPVVNLQSNVEITSGNGTYKNPYIIK